MFIKSVFIFYLISIANSVSLYPNKEKCKNMDIEQSVIQITKEEKVNFKKKTPLLFDIKFFVIHDNNIGKVSKDRLYNQINILNKAFKGKQHNLGVNSKISFQIKQIRYINNAKLYKSCGKREKEIINTYKGDTKKYISVYICDDETLGYAYYPWHENEGHIEQVVFMNEIAVTGSNFNLYNIGLTLVHELGHFFGLPHTFNNKGKCSNSGDDGYSDTPVEKTPNYGCDTTRDTCPNFLGNDPIWNYMDYTRDSCMNRFTKEQVNDMLFNIDYYRPKLRRRSINNYKTTTKTSTTKTTTTKTTTTKTTKTTTSNTIKTTTVTTSLYKICGNKNKKKCNKYNKCYWHDHYIKCYPKTHEDNKWIFCDVRRDANPNKTSKYKCKLQKYSEKCKWNNRREKCVPK